MDSSILAAFAGLDESLLRAVARAEQRYGGEAAADPYRGLYVSLDGVRRAFSRQGGEPLLADAIGETPAPLAGPPQGRWAELVDAFGLDMFELNVLLVALAPEIDLRYERIYAYLQDDV